MTFKDTKHSNGKQQKKIDKSLFELKVWKLYKIIICMCGVLYYIHASTTIFYIYKSFYAVRVN